MPAMVLAAVFHHVDHRPASRALIVECEVFASPPEWSVQSLRAYLQRSGFETEADGNLLYAARPDGGA